MPLTIIVRVTRDCHGFFVMRAASRRDCKTTRLSRRAAGANAVDGYFHCHRFRPRPVSVGDKSIGAAIIPGGLYPAWNAIDTIDAAEQIGLRISRRPESVIRARTGLLSNPTPDAGGAGHHQSRT